MPNAQKKNWLGGPIRWGKKGPTYVIDRWIHGKHWHVSTRCRTERAAVKELEKFEADPAGYRQLRQRAVNGVAMTPELIDEYLEWQRGQGFDPGHIRQTEMCLTRILGVVGLRDLSRTPFIELRDIIDSTADKDKPAARMARRKAMKGFGSWLRKEKGLLTRGNDPTIELQLESATPEKNRRRKAMTLEFVEKAIAQMDPDVADVAVTLAGSGLHISELIRLHAGHGGLHEPEEWQRAAGVILTIVVRHKSGQLHAVAVGDPAVAAAVRRVLERKTFPSRGRITKQDVRTSKRLGAKFSMGWLRHSVATWLARKQTPEEAIAKQLGHSSTDMVRTTYIDMGLTAHLVPIPHLRLVKAS